MRSNKALTRYVWLTLVFNLGVILMGAYVRASGSGAGCGNHWPLCNGEILPTAPQVQTLVEFSHRLTSGAALLLVIGLFVWVFRTTPQAHPARLPAALSLVFILIEALIGAGLVLFELVADNASTARAASTSIHLANTFLLLAALTLTGVAAARGRPLQLNGKKQLVWVLGAGMAAILLVGMSGAVTALGDTLFPAASLAEGIQQDLNPQSHFLVRLRVLHPVLSVLAGFYLVFLAALLRNRREAGTNQGLPFLLTILVFVQLGAGALNIVLMAPIWLQLIHLLLADLLWIVLILLAANLLEPGQTRVFRDADSQLRLETAP